MADQGSGIGLLGIGAALPDRIRTNADWETPPRVVDAISDAPDPFRGAVERRVLEPERESSDLEIEACRAALEIAGRSVGEVGHLFGFSQTPRWLQPGNHGPVARGLGLGSHTLAMSIDSGCASFVSQLHVASRLLVDSDRPALMYQSCVASRTTDYSGPLAPVVGDGAVAQVVGRVEPGLGLIGIEQKFKPELSEGLVMCSSDRRARWTDPAAEGSFYFDDVRDGQAAREMARNGPDFARETCGRLLERHGYTADDVDLFACTQPSLWFGQACAARVGVRSGCVVPPAEHFQKYAHLLPASAPLNLWVAWRSGRLEKGDLVLMYLQGAGFIQAAVLLRWAMERPG